MAGFGMILGGGMKAVGNNRLEMAKEKRAAALDELKFQRQMEGTRQLNKESRDFQAEQNQLTRQSSSDDLQTRADLDTAARKDTQTFTAGENDKKRVSSMEELDKRLKLDDDQAIRSQIMKTAQDLMLKQGDSEEVAAQKAYGIYSEIKKQQDMPRPTTREEMDALGPGVDFISPDGSPGRTPGIPEKVDTTIRPDKSGNYTEFAGDAPVIPAERRGLMPASSDLGERTANSPGGKAIGAVRDWFSEPARGPDEPWQPSIEFGPVKIGGNVDAYNRMLREKEQAGK